MVWRWFFRSFSNNKGWWKIKHSETWKKISWERSIPIGPAKWTWTQRKKEVLPVSICLKADFSSPPCSYCMHVKSHALKKWPVRQGCIWVGFLLNPPCLEGHCLRQLKLFNALPRRYNHNKGPYLRNMMTLPSSSTLWLHLKVPKPKLDVFFLKLDPWTWCLTVNHVAMDFFPRPNLRKGLGIPLATSTMRRQRWILCASRNWNWNPLSWWIKTSSRNEWNVKCW